MNSDMIQAFAALEAHRSAVAQVPMRKRFADDPERFKRFSIVVPRSPSRLFEEPDRRRDDAAALRARPRRPRSRSHRAAMFAGEAINRTENRPVLHVALRALPDEVYRVGGRERRAGGPCRAQPHGGLRRRRALRRDRGAGGQFTDVVNIGIGGSDLGPRMATRALTPYHDGPRIHFVSNVDGADIRDTLAGLDPAARCSSSPRRPSPPSRP